MGLGRLIQRSGARALAEFDAQRVGDRRCRSCARGVRAPERAQRRSAVPLTTKPPGPSPNRRLNGIVALAVLVALAGEGVQPHLGAEAAREAALGQRDRQAALGDVVGA